MRLRWLTGCVGLAAVFLAFASPAGALPSTVRIAFDTDGVATGDCTVATADGPFAGAELLLTATIETGNATGTVQALELQECAATVFGPPVVVDPGSWPVGIGLGEGGSHVVEAHVPLVDLGPLAPSIRFGIVHVAGADEDALLQTAPASGQPIVLGLPEVLEIPTLSEWGLLALLLLLTTVALRKLGRPEIQVLVLLIGLLGVCGWAWAACVMDGITDDWSPSDLLALDSSDDAPDSVDLHAFFAKVDGAELCLRVDTDLAFDQPPLAGDDPFDVAQGSVDNSLDVLANDSDPEGMPLTIVSVGTPDQGGSASTDGLTVLYSPAAGFVGVETFSYTVGDGQGGADTATVTVTVTPLCGNGTQDAYPQALAICPGQLYGATVPGPTSASDLYSLDPSTGVGTLIGTIAIAPAVPNPVRRISAMDFAPDGGLYGVGTVGNNLVLVQIDCQTAEATVIGQLGLTAAQGRSITDMDFDSFGRLWVHYNSPDGDELGTVNRTTGGYTAVGATSLDDIGNGLSSGGFPAGSLYHAGGASLSTLDEVTGSATPVAALTFPPDADDLPRINAMDEDFATGITYASLDDKPAGDGSLPQNFVTGLDLATGEVSALTDPAPDAPDSLDAIAVNRVYETCDTGSSLPVGASCGGTCQLVETNCADATDNDADGSIDCGDPDCEVQACDDLDACTDSDVCVMGACGGDPVDNCVATLRGEGLDGDSVLLAELLGCASSSPFRNGGGLSTATLGGGGVTCVAAPLLEDERQRELGLLNRVWR